MQEITLAGVWMKEVPWGHKEDHKEDALFHTTVNSGMCSFEIAPVHTLADGWEGYGKF